MKPILFTLVISIACGISAPLGRCGEPDAVPAPKTPREQFPHRTDLPAVDSLTNDPTHTFPIPISQPPPQYPMNLARGVYKLTVAFIIEKNGRVKEAVIVDSSGIAAIDDAHLVAVKKWKFKPARLRGKPIANVAKQPFTVDWR